MWERKQPNAFMEHNFVELKEIRPDRAVCVLRIRPESRNPYGLAHGGAIYTIADDVAGLAAHTDGRSYVTQDSTMHFLANRTEGLLTGVGEVRHRGRHSCLVEVSVTAEDGALLAAGSFLYFCVDATVRKVPELEG